MKTITKKVFYCDFCKKHSLSKYHMGEHERHCTANPKRECGACGMRGLDTHYKIEEIKIKGDLNLVHNNKGIIIKGDDCPFCALAYIRQSKVSAYFENGEYWDYKKAVADWLEMENEARQASM